MEPQPAKSSRNISLLVDWLRLCIGEHNKCKNLFSGECLLDADKNVPLPTRVIDVGESANQGAQAKILATKGCNGRYLALSHRWGQLQRIRSVRANIDEFQRFLPEEDLPLTFRDAIATTRLLGFRYLWIDCLCIIQDDEIDWKREAESMGRIFERSCCTLAALDSLDTEGIKDHGLFQPVSHGPPSATLHCPLLNVLEIREFQDPDKGNESYIHQIRLHPHPSANEIRFRARIPQGWYLAMHAPWRKRGWILQERVLSRRIIYFSKSKLFWDCKLIQGDEDGLQRFGFAPHRGPAMESSNEPGVSGMEQGKSQQWEYLVEDYSSCDLTFGCDKANAIAGICERFTARYALRIDHGVLEDTTGKSLLWRAKDRDLKQYKDFKAPSWSWMRFEGPVTYSLGIPDLECQATPLVSDLHFIESYRLSVLAPLWPAALGSTIDELDLLAYDQYVPIFGSPIYNEGVENQRNHRPTQRWEQKPNPELPRRTRVLERSRSKSIIGWALLDTELEGGFCRDIVCMGIQGWEATGATRRSLCAAPPSLYQTSLWEFEKHVDVLILEKCSSQTDAVTYRRVGRGRLVKGEWDLDEKQSRIIII